VCGRDAGEITVSKVPIMVFECPMYTGGFDRIARRGVEESGGWEKFAQEGSCLK